MAYLFIYDLLIYLFLMLAVSVFRSFREPWTCVNQFIGWTVVECFMSNMSSLYVTGVVTGLMCSRSRLLRNKLHPASNSSDSQVCLCVNIHTYLTLIERYVGSINSAMSWDLKPQQCAGRDIFVSRRESLKSQWKRDKIVWHL